MTIGAIAGAGNMTLGSGFTLTTNASSNTTFSGVISGAGSLTKTGTGALTLNGTNTYTGGTTLNAGTISLGHANGLGTSGNITFTGGGLQYGSGITTDISSRIKNSTGAILVDTNGNNVTFASALDSTNSSGFIKNGAGVLSLSGNNTYTGDTTINAGTLEIASTGLLGGGNYSGNIVNTGAFIIGSNSNQILSGAISGIGALTKNGTGTLTLSGNNNYSGGTTLNTGTLVIGHANAAGTGTITQANGSSLLKIDTTGTITNAMSVYNVLASQSATLSGAITVNNATWDIETGDTLTISGAVSGSGGVTKNGAGTLILSGNNSYLAPTVINAGTLNAANAGALGSNNTVQVNGGTLLVTADDAINGKNIELGGSGVGLRFSGTYNGSIGLLTLSANSIIDLGPGSVQILFQGLNLSGHTLSFYNWTGSTLWNGGTGADTDKVFLFPTIDPGDLNKISFYSGNGGDSFLGSGFDLGLEATGFIPAMGNQIIPVPEPETYATGLLLLLGGAVWMWKRKPNTCQRALAGQPAEGSPKGETSGSERGNA
jgi:autotransporter-associated beta strand protein